MTVYLSADNLTNLCTWLGVGPVRDPALLASAAGRPTMTMFGADLFPDLPGKAAALLHGIVTSHPLLDGNKRLGWTACDVFCRLNGVELNAKNEDVVAFVVDIATHVLPDVDAVREALVSRFIQ